MGCPSDNEIAELVSGGLPGAARETLEEHLDTCPDCRRHVSALAAALPVESFVRMGGAATLPLGAGSDDVTVSGDDLSDGLHPLPGQELGRYRVLSVLGTGAMGFVVRARDPELERDVAIKLLRPELWRRAGARAREALRNEARALARLRHENVVAVHDLGTVGDQLFVTMELLSGRTLRELMREDRPPPEELLSYLAGAARGLEAAHRAGVVHGDVKPDNIFVTTDGRAVVADFGLARLAGAAQSVTGGTPGYIAPEVERDPMAASAASDQYAFAVAAVEILGDAAVPEASRRAIERGRSPDPDERLPSMADLAEALEPSSPPAPRRRWGVAAVLAVLVCAGAGIGGYAALSGGSPPGRDDRAREQVAQVWNDETRSEVSRAFATAGLPDGNAAADRAIAALDAFARDWIAERSAAWGAFDRGDVDGADLGVRLACLDRRLDELAYVAGVLAEVDDAEALRGAAKLEHELTPIERCADAEVLARQPPPPDDPGDRARLGELNLRLAALRARFEAGDYPAVAEAAESFLEEARALGYAPLVARVLLLLSDVRVELREEGAAEKAARDALEHAARGRDDASELRAWNQLLYIIGVRGGRVDDALALLPAAEAALERSGDPFLQAQHDRSVGALLVEARRFDEAETRYRRALGALEGREGAAALVRATVYHNLGVLEYYRDDVRAALAAFRQSRQQWIELVGEDHLDVADATNNIASMLSLLGRDAEALEEMRRAAEVYAASLGEGHPRAIDGRNNLGVMLRGMARYDDAVAAHQEALASLERGDDDPVRRQQTLRRLGIAAHWADELALAERSLKGALELAADLEGEDSDAVAEVRVELAAVKRKQGDSTAGVELCREALAVQERPDRGHGVVTNTLLELGLSLLDAGRPAEAEKAFGRALPLLDDDDPPAHGADIRLGLARALAAQGRNRSRALELAREARAGIADSDLPHNRELVAEIDAFLATL